MSKLWCAFAVKAACQDAKRFPTVDISPSKLPDKLPVHPLHCGVPSATSWAGANCHRVWDNAPDATWVWFVRVPEEGGDKNMLGEGKWGFQSVLLLLNLSLAGSWRFGCREALQLKPLFIDGAFYADAISVAPCRHGVLVPRLYLWGHLLVGWIRGLQYLMYNCSALLFRYAFNLCAYLWLCLLFCITAKCDEQYFLGPFFPGRQNCIVFVLVVCIVYLLM